MRRGASSSAWWWRRLQRTIDTSSSSAASQSGRSRPAPAGSWARLAISCWSAANGVAVAGVGGGDGRADEGTHAVDRQRAREAFAEPLGDAGQADAVLVAQLFEAGQVGVGRFGGALGEGLLPQLGGGGAVVADEDFVGHHDGPQVPGDAIVRGPQPQEIDERVEQLAVVGVRGRRVVVAVLAVVLDDRFDGEREPLGRFVARDAPAQLGDEANVFGLGVLLQVREPDADALMQDRPQVAEVEKLLREQVGAVALDERDERLPFVCRRRVVRRRSAAACGCGRASG